jgi:hypothetical protein
MRSHLAVGAISLLNPRFRKWLVYYVPLLSKKVGVRLIHYSNNGSHLHLVVKPQTKTALSTFLRALGGMIPRKVLRAEKGRAKGLKFWVGRPYTRVLSWGREFHRVMLYVQRHVLESARKITYVSRQERLCEADKNYIAQSFKEMRHTRTSSLQGQLLLF